MQAAIQVPADAWTPAYDGDDQVADGAWVADITRPAGPGRLTCETASESCLDQRPDSAVFVKAVFEDPTTEFTRCLVRMIAQFTEQSLGQIFAVPTGSGQDQELASKYAAARLTGNRAS